MPAYDLTPEQKAAIITQRLQQFAAEKFQHELNKTTAEAIGDTTAAATSVAAIAQLDTAIGVHETELALVVNRSGGSTSAVYGFLSGKAFA